MMQRPLRTVPAAVAMISSLAFGQVAMAQPRSLSNAELDGVTAGVTLNQLSAAVALGSLYAEAQTNAGGSTSYTPLTGGGFVESGAIGGTASATSNTGQTATQATTSGSVNGYPLVNTTVGGSVSSPTAQASVSFTYVAGGTFFLPL
ncbi:hypothetical protein GCM10011611_27520 [Aliidongia dinghuensis]|uniref:Uncharacterized protein n=1 Tax=Aliidongia dinghuensis TaxID=1867774 RepID=A0A8J2YVB9_9PROT|nr:hypothetical protein [Aliidongia dinghuensis]GGF20014.1 hypothetical protein GCM10011611_27520 [Aliidongia dinghuensis]